MRKILVTLRGDKVDVDILKTASRLTKLLKAHLLGFCAIANVESAIPFLGDGLTFPVTDDLAFSVIEHLHENDGHAYSNFLNIMREESLNLEQTPSCEHLPSASFFAHPIKRDGPFQYKLRLCDLAIFSQSYQSDLVGIDVFEDILLDSRRPVLLLPDEGVFEFHNKKAFFAWNGSSAAARALLRAMPILQHMSGVVIVSIQKNTQILRYLTDEVTACLGLYGVPAEIIHADNIDAEHTGQFLLDKAYEHDASLMIMGAYGSGRLRELLLGGVTRYMRTNTTLPLFMAR